MVSGICKKVGSPTRSRRSRCAVLESRGRRRPRPVTRFHVRAQIYCILGLLDMPGGKQTFRRGLMKNVEALSLAEPHESAALASRSPVGCALSLNRSRRKPPGLCRLTAPDATMLLGGLWHGAAVDVCRWRGLHGLYCGPQMLALEKRPESPVMALLSAPGDCSRSPSSPLNLSR
jgi:hypothetical protein